MKRLLTALLVCVLLAMAVMGASVLSVSAEGDTISYQEQEYNDSTYSANTIGHNYVTSGIVDGTYDDDYFRFEVTELSEVSIAGLASTTDIAIYVTDSYGNGVLTMNPSEPAENYYSYGDKRYLGAGTYYINLYYTYYGLSNFTAYAFGLEINPHQHSYTANCDESCDECGEIRTDWAHAYDNDCDKSCNDCGATREIAHSYKKKVTQATQTKDGKIKNVCTKCGYTSSKVTTIYKASSIKLSKTSYTYDGKTQKPSVVVKDSKGNKISSSHYTVTYASGCKNVGTYKVTVKLKGNYSDTKTLTFKINPISISKCKLSLSTTTYSYNGKAKTPSVTVKNAKGSKLTKNTHYTVSYASGRKNVGTYKVTVKMKGNYSGTKTLTFTVAPTTKTSMKVVVGGTASIGAKSNKKITYSSSKKSVATVSSKGVITGKKAGTATITVKSGSITKKIKVTIAKPSISITAKAKSVYRGKKLQLTANKLPTSAKVTWSVNNKKIATVSSSGVVTGKKAGTVTVTAKMTYKGKTYKDTYKVQVKVESPNISVFISQKSKYTDLYAVSLTNNGSKKLTVTGEAWVYVGGESAYSNGQMFVDNGFCTSFTMGKGSVTYVYTLEEKLLFLSSYRVACYIYFEYDGEKYMARCDSSIYGLNRCESITRLK